MQPRLRCFREERFREKPGRKRNEKSIEVRFLNGSSKRGALLAGDDIADLAVETEGNLVQLVPRSDNLSARSGRGPESPNPTGGRHGSRFNFPACRSLSNFRTGCRKCVGQPREKAPLLLLILIHRLTNFTRHMGSHFSFSNFERSVLGGGGESESP